MQPVPSSAVGAAPPGAAVIYVPAQTGSRIFDGYKHRQSIRLGITQVIIGILCVVFNSVCLALSSYEGRGLCVVGHGYWCGILFMITGVYGIIAGKKRTGCQIIAFMVLCIISAAFTIIVFILGILGAFIASFYGYHCYRYENGYNIPCSSMPYVQGSIAMSSCMAILGFVEAIVAIWGSVLCCRSGVCCCSTPTVSMPAVGYYPNTGNMIYMNQVHGGPHVYTATSSVSYPQGQFPPPVYAQPGWAMPSTSIGQDFAQPPPAYATDPAQQFWMIPPATTKPDPFGPQAPPSDPFSYQTKESA